jgi:hypothetical protein
MCMRRASSSCPRTYWFYENTLHLRKLISLVFFSHRTPLHLSACGCGDSHLEIYRLLLEHNADVLANGSL